VGEVGSFVKTGNDQWEREVAIHFTEREAQRLLSEMTGVGTKERFHQSAFARRFETPSAHPRWIGRQMARACPVCASEVCMDHCVLCGVDIRTEEHAADCPSTTGVFTITHRDLDMRVCPKCQHEYPGDRAPACGRCHKAFVIGDAYTHIKIAEDIGEVVCLGCAALELGRANDA
jgi:hypothetical protein